MLTGKNKRTRERMIRCIAFLIMGTQIFFPFFAHAEVGAGPGAIGGGPTGVGIPGLVVPVFDPVAAGIATYHAGVTTYIASPAELKTFKDYVLDTIARVATLTVIRGLTNSIVGWIQGGGGGLVENLEQEFKIQADAAGGEILNEIAGINLCGDLSAFLQLTLRSPRSKLRAQLECTATDIVQNVENHYRDFSEGGWPAFVSLSIEPGNTAAGAYFISLDSKIAAERKQRETTLAKYLAGDGFLGLTEEVEVCEPARNRAGRQTGQTTCRREKTIKLPGKQVSAFLEKSLNIEFDFLNVADELNESIIAISNALLTRLINSSYSVSRPGRLGAQTFTGPGLFSSELSDIAPPDVQEAGGESVQKLVDESLLRANELLRAVDTSIFSARQQIFAARAQDPPGETTSLEGTLANLQNQKTTLLETQFGLLLLKNSTAAARTTDTLTSRAQQAQSLSVRVDGLARDLNINSFTNRASGNAQNDALLILSGARQNLNNEVSLINLTIAELDRLASTTAATSSALQRDIRANKQRAQTQKTLLTTALGRTAELQNDLSFAVDENVIDGLIRDMSEAIIAANQSIEQVDRVISRDIDPFLGIHLPEETQSGANTPSPSGGTRTQTPEQQGGGEGER